MGTYLMAFTCKCCWHPLRKSFPVRQKKAEENRDSVLMTPLCVFGHCLHAACSVRSIPRGDAQIHARVQVWRTVGAALVRQAGNLAGSSNDELSRSVAARTSESASTRPPMNFVGSSRRPAISRDPLGKSIASVSCAASISPLPADRVRPCCYSGAKLPAGSL